MIKKIIILISLIGISFSNIFAYNIDTIKILYIHKLNKIETNISSKYKDHSKVCYYKKKLYQRIDKALNLYKYRYPKYKLIFSILLEIDNYREVQIKNNCDRFKFLKILNKKNSIQNTNQSYNNNYKKESRDNVQDSSGVNKSIQNNTKITDNTIKLKFKINKIDYDYNGEIIFNTSSNNITLLPSVGEINTIYDNFIVKVNNHLISLKKAITIKVPENQLQSSIDYAKKKYHKDFVFYKKEGNEYKLYLINRKNIYFINTFNSSKSVNYNINQLNRVGYLYIKNFYYKKINKDGIFIGGIIRYNNKLYYIIESGTGKYINIAKKKFIKNISYIEGIKKGTIIIDQGSNLMIWTKGMQIFYLGKFNMYKNIDLKKLGEILYHTFHIICKYKLPYTVKSMYNLIDFTKQFNGKFLKEAYISLTSNFIYNKNINNLLNKKGMNQKILDNEIIVNKKLIQNWNIFYSLKNKEGICESISDIFSLIALFNGQKADIVIGTTSNGYLHQISKINGKYYDPTLDLGNNKNNILITLGGFNISKKQIEKYFDFKNK